MRVLAFVFALIVTAIPASAFAQNAQAYATSAQQRVDAAQRIVTVLTLQYSSGTATLDDVATWAARVFQAKRDTPGTTIAAHIAAAEQWVNKMRAIEQIAQQRVRGALAPSVEADKAAFYRLEAEMALAKLKTP